MKDIPSIVCTAHLEPLIDDFVGKVGHFLQCIHCVNLSKLFKNALHCGHGQTECGNSASGTSHMKDGEEVPREKKMPTSLMVFF